MIALTAARWLLTSWPGRALLLALAVLAFGGWQRHRGATQARDEIRASEALQTERARDAGDKAAAIAGGDDPADRMRRGDW